MFFNSNKMICLGGQFMAKRIYILGKKGPDTYDLERKVCHVMAKSGLKRYTVRILEDPEEIFRHGVSLMPALVIDGFVRTIGRVPSEAEIENILYLTGSIKKRKISPGLPKEFLL